MSATEARDGETESSSAHRLARKTASPLWLQRMLWLGVVLTALAFRSVGPDWDGGIAAHPDERYLLGAAQSTDFLGNVCLSNPQFPYGHLPVLVAQLLVASAPSADPLYAARLVSALVGVVIVAISGAAAQALVGRRAGLIAAALAAIAPGLIQQGHFYTVDPLATAFVCAGVLAGTRNRWRLAGALTGLAIACKASLVISAIPLLLVAVLAPQGSGGRLRARGMLAWRAYRFLAPLGLAFAATSPWAVLTPRICWEGPLLQSMIVSGRYVVPYTQQYLGTAPLLYPLGQIALWGLGPVTPVLACIAMLQQLRHAPRLATALLHPAWLWTVASLLVLGSLQVKFPRYLLPLYPWLCAWAASVVTPGKTSAPDRLSDKVGRVVLLVTTGFLGLAQVSIYRADHPWLEASRWLYEHLQPGSTIAVEAWEHPLPVPLPASSPEQYRQTVVPVYEADSSDKTRQLTAASGSDVIVVASRRGYSALARQDDVYGATLSWYSSLLTHRTVVAFARCPHVGPVAVTDDPLADAGLPVDQTLAERCGTLYALRLPRLDESFRVYDAPMTLLLTNRED